MADQPEEHFAALGVPHLAKPPRSQRRVRFDQIPRTMLSGEDATLRLNAPTGPQMSAMGGEVSCA